MMKKIKAWIKLVNTKGIGPTKIKQLINKFGSPDNFIGCDRKELKDLNFITPAIRDQLDKKGDPKQWSKIAKLIEKYEIKFVSILDENYPYLLKNIFSPPPFLFYRGNLKESDCRRSLAVVGTRKPSNYGKLMTKRIVGELSEYKFTIISGLAYGIDTVAHLSAIEGNTRTIAVLGTGCEQIYPPRNRELAERILENGALISEYVPGTKIEKWNFPKRNRIISGLSLGCLVTEGKRNSGALLTAKFALDQNRDLFALPGDINRNQAQGPNFLISKGAKLISSAKSITDEYELLINETKAREEVEFPKLNTQEKEVFEIIVNKKPQVSFDELIIESKLTVNELSSILFNLEIKSLIKKVAGNKIIPLY